MVASTTGAYPTMSKKEKPFSVTMWMVVVFPSQQKQGLYSVTSVMKNWKCNECLIIGQENYVGFVEGV